MRVTFTLNGKPTTISADPARPLLDVLRNDLGLTGTKQGCDHEGECGACTVLLDGAAVRSCLTPVGKVAGREVQTVEGLGSPDQLHPLQAAFIEAGAIQCGFCTPGMLMAAKGLLDRSPDPTEAEIIDALEGNLCRCTGYVKIIDGVRLAASRLRGDAPGPGIGDRPAVIGGSPLREDSVAKVTGQAKYVEDMSLPGMLHGRVLRSPHHHARLVALETERAGGLPGVVRVLTARDIPGLNSFDEYSRDEPVLPEIGATVRMLGAPVALVVAETADAADAALDALQPVYEVLPHTFDVTEALRPDAVHIAGSHNVLNTYQVRHGDIEAALAGADIVIEAEYDTSFLEHAALERESLLGYIDDSGRITIVGGTHQPHLQQRFISDTLAVPVTDVRVILPPTGGTFGGKQDPWPFLATALMVYHTRRPVRLIYTRGESFVATPKRHPYHHRLKIGATPEGRLTGIRARIDANTGAYDAHGQYIANYAVTAMGGPYRWPAADVSARTVYTNTAKGGQFRGFGTAQSVFASECALDELIQRLGADPLAFRLENRLREGEPSFLGYPVAESLGFEEVLAAVKPSYETYLAESRAFNAAHSDGRLRRGVGVAGMWYRFGKSGSLRVETHAELRRDGKLAIYCSAPDYGQGTNTVMSQMAAEAFGVSRERIVLVNADTALVPDSDIQGASRATYFVGSSIVRAARNLKDEILGMAAEMLDASPADLVFNEERVTVNGHEELAISLADVAEEFDRVGKPRRIVGIFDLSDRFPAEERPEYVPFFITGAHVAEVVVDTDTGETRVLRLAAAHDIGKAINPIDAQGQIEGAVLMGLGSALMEEFLPGQSSGFSNYYLPTAKSMPQIEVHLVEVTGYHAAHGVKGLGEAAMLPTAPAVINAMSRAIGGRLRVIPATPERVLAAIQRANEETDR